MLEFQEKSNGEKQNTSQVIEPDEAGTTEPNDAIPEGPEPSLTPPPYDAYMAALDSAKAKAAQPPLETFDPATGRRNRRSKMLARSSIATAVVHGLLGKLTC